MNRYLITAGLFAAATTAGHFLVGSRRYLEPMLQATFDPLARKVMHCVFHYTSAFLILSAAALLLAGSGFWSGAGPEAVAGFIAANFALFAVWQLLLAAVSGIPGAPFRLFQWVFFVGIALFSWLGSGG